MTIVNEPTRKSVNLKVTKKDLAAFSEIKFTIYSVNEDGSRASTYGNAWGTHVIKELFNQRRRTIVLFDEDRKEFEKAAGYFPYGDLRSMKDPDFARKAEEYRVTIHQEF